MQFSPKESSATSLTCIIGGLIADNFYSEDLEDKVVLQWNVGEPVRVALARSHPDLPLSPFYKSALEWKILSRLQMAHDRTEFFNDFIDQAPHIIAAVLEEEYTND